jgi:hypothetical protein
VPTRPDEQRGLAHLEVLLGEKGFQTLLYVVDFSNSCVSALTPAGFSLVEATFD